jgi:hypothetical protein
MIDFFYRIKTTNSHTITPKNKKIKTCFFPFGIQ